MYKLNYHITKQQLPISDRRVTDSAVCSQTFREIYRICGAEIEDVEKSYALFMNGSSRIIGFCELSSGGSSSTVIDNRMILRFAILCNASQIALCHNHPSGDPHPSRADMASTKSLRAACETVGVDLLDHIILSERTYYSFADN